MEDIQKTQNDESSSEDWTITFCVIGKACSNTRLLSALEDRYAYECINNDEQVLRTLSETKQLLTKRQLRIYVVESFDEVLFYNLKEDENIYIISAELVLACAEKKIDIPVPRRNRPLYSQHLSSAVICFVGGTRREIHTKFSDIVHYLGGSVRKDYGDQVTHVVSFANLGEKYLTAFNMERSEILTEDWLLECWKERDNRIFDALDPDFIRMYRAKPLHNLSLYFFGAADETEQRHLHTLAVDNGGFTTNEISDATHVVFCNGMDASTFLSAHPSYKRKHRQHIVNVQWFWECLCLMGKADESSYSVKLPGMNETTTPDSPRSTLLSLSTLSPLSTSINDSNYIQQQNTTTSVKRKRRKESNSNNNDNNTTPNTKRFNSSNENENGLDDDMIVDTFDKQPKTPVIKKDNKYLISMEIRETEKNYVTMLSNIIRFFKTEMEKDDRRNGPILTKVESTQIFGNIEEIYHLHLAITEQLDRAINEDACVGTVFLANAAELLRVYQPYTKFYDKTIQAIHSFEKNNSRFYAFLKICEHKSELGKQHLADLMIRPIQRLPSILLLLERLLKYTPITHMDYQQLTNAIDKLREVAKKLNEERGKTEKHLSLFGIVNSIDNCPPELLAAHRDYLQKFNLIELSQELTGKRTHLTLFLFSDCIEITKLRVNTWKTPGVKSTKSYKHVALIQLSDIRSLFDIASSSCDENEQFGMLCSIDGQARQLIFRVADNNNMSISRSHLTDSMTSLTSLSTISSLNQTSKTEVLHHLAKAIAEERCLLDKTSLIENVGPENGAYTPLSSMDFMSDNDTLSTHSTMSATTSSGLNSVGSALRSGLYKAKSRLSRTFSFSPISSKNRLKKMLTSNSSLLHINDKDNNNFNTMKRLSVPSRQDSFTSERNFPHSPSRFMHSIKEY